MRGSQKSELKGKAFFYKLAGLKREDEKAIFEVATKEDGKIVHLEDDWEIAGDVVEIKSNIGHTKSEPIRKIYGVKLILKDESVDEFYFVEFTLGSMVGRSILNNLAGGDRDLNHVRLSLYMSKKGYKSAWVEVNRGDPEWLLSWEEQEKMTRKIKDPETGEVIKTDSTKLQEYFLETVLPIVANKIKKPDVDDSPNGDSTVISPDTDTDVISSDEVKANIDLVKGNPPGDLKSVANERDPAAKEPTPIGEEDEDLPFMISIPLLLGMFASWMIM